VTAIHKIVNQIDNLQETSTMSLVLMDSRFAMFEIIHRNASEILLSKAKQYPILAITGPRQSGKSTLSKALFSDKPYCNLEALDQRQFATQDPRGFLQQFPNGAILDEIQHCPELFSYLQVDVDANPLMGRFILTGSQQFGLTEKISQSLAGRVGYLQLLPFTLGELQEAKAAPETPEELLFKGLYPPIYDRSIPPSQWYSDYAMTYIERDVRQLINIQDLRLFRHFLQMCAARTGQILNLSSLASDCGITHNTAKAWISILETSYIVFLLSPHHQNFNKRLIKSPKLYFYDTGLACLLLNLQNSEQLITHPIRGALFETWVMSELMKKRFNQGLRSNLYFWRDSQGHEIDGLIDQGDKLIAIEIKAGQTLNADYFKGLEYWQTLSEQKEGAQLIYAGLENQTRKNIEVVSWKSVR